MRSILLGARSSLISVLVAALIGLPVRGASSLPLATVLSAQDAHLANADAVPGADVYFDDDLVTGPGGSLRLAVGANQVYLLAQTQAVLRQDQGRIQAKMYRGTLGFSTSAPDTLYVDTPFATVRGANGSRVLGQISVVTSPNPSEEQIVVTSYQGTLLVVDNAGQSKTIEEGGSYIGTLAADTAGGNGNSDAKRKGVGAEGINWRHVLEVAIPIAIVGGVAIALYATGSESCSRPNCAPPTR